MSARSSPDPRNRRRTRCNNPSRFPAFSHFSTGHETEARYVNVFPLSRAPEVFVPKFHTQASWEFLLSASRNTLQSYELSRLGHAANLHEEIAALLDQWLEENAAALLARYLIDQRRFPGCQNGGFPKWHCVR
jgi:hypothetical protein